MTPIGTVSRSTWQKILVEKHLPEQYRRKPGWRHVSNEIANAAQGEKGLLEICVSLRLVLALEGVERLMQ